MNKQSIAFEMYKMATYGAYGPQTGVKPIKTSTKPQRVSAYKNFKSNDVGSKEVKVGPVDTIAKLASIYTEESDAKRALTEDKIRNRIKGYKNRLEVSNALRKASDGRR
jgi:hypothetical protein